MMVGIMEIRKFQETYLQVKDNQGQSNIRQDRAIEWTLIEILLTLRSIESKLK